MLKAFDVEAQHQRQPPDGHLLDGALLQPTPLARPPLAGAQALRSHKSVQAAHQTGRAVLRHNGRRARTARNVPVTPPGGAGLPRRIGGTRAVVRSCRSVIRGRGAAAQAGRRVNAICGRSGGGARRNRNRKAAACWKAEASRSADGYMRLLLLTVGRPAIVRKPLLIQCSSKRQQEGKTQPLRTPTREWELLACFSHRRSQYIAFSCLENNMSQI